MEGARDEARDGSGTPSAPERVAGPAGLVSLATGLSRIVGLLREMVFAALFGAGLLADAFVYAFRIPNLLRDFFAEGALASSFVPTFTRVRTEEGEARAFALARRTLGTLAAVAGAIVLLGIVFAPAVVGVVAVDAPEALRPLTIRLTRIMFPFLLFVSLAAVVMGVLNAYRRYFVPAVAPACFNVVAVLGGLGLLAAALAPEHALELWAVLVLLGGLAQLVVQLPLLRRIGWRGAPTPDLALRDPALREVVRRMGPVVIGLAGTNVMIVITTALASRGDGWAASLAYAFRLVHLPIGVIGVALGTVVLSAASRRRAAKDEAGLDELVRRGLRLDWFLALPAAAGLFVLADPIVRLVYERGAFDVADARDTAAALRWYAFGVPFYAGVKAAAPLFLARGDTKTPMACSLLGIGANLAVAFGLVGVLGMRALALAVAVGATTNYAALRLVGLRRYGRGSAVEAGYLLRVLLAVAALAGAAALAEAWAIGGDEAVNFGAGRSVATLVVVVGLTALYGLLAAALGIDEGRQVVARLKRRPGR